MAESQEKQLNKSVRVWQTMDVEAARKHLLYVEDLYGHCGNCKQIGLNYLKDSKCTKCGTEFKYLATKLTNPGEVQKLLTRIAKEGLNLKLIDRSDFERVSARDAVHKLFS